MSDGGKELTFYSRYVFFWIKLTLFAAVFLLELAAMLAFIRVRIARAKGTALPRFPLDTYRRINAAELVLVITIVFMAAFMARAAWMF